MDKERPNVYKNQGIILNNVFIQIQFLLHIKIKKDIIPSNRTFIIDA